MQIKKNRMGYAPVLPLLLSMALPLMFSMFIGSLYNIVDSYFVAKMSEKAFRALSYVFPVQLVLIGVGVGSGVGISALVARMLGEERRSEALLVISHGFIFVLAVSMLFTLAGIFLPGPFYRFFTSDHDVISMGSSYMRIVLLFSAASMIQISLEKAIQGTGHTIFPMLSQLVGAVVNIVLDPIMIFGYLGFPAMGIKGAAIATIIGQIAGAALSLYYLVIRNEEAHLTFKGFKLKPYIFKSIFKIGFPTTLMQSVASVLTIGLNKMLYPYSEFAVSALGIYYKLQSFVFLPIFGLSQGVLPLVAFNYGARKKERIDETLKHALKISMAVMILGVLIFNIFPEQLLKIFSEDGYMDPELVKIGLRSLKIISFCFPIAGVCILASTFFQAMAHSGYSLAISAFRQLIIILPVAQLLLWQFGLDYVWYAYPIADLATAGISYYFFRHIYNSKVRVLRTEDLAQS